MAVTTVEFGLPKAKKLHPLCGFGAQFNTNLFTEAGQSPLLTDDQVGALRAAIKSLKLGHSRIFVRPVARSSGVQRDALMSTIKLAHETGANVNLTWWKGPFPHEPQRDHAEKRRKLMDDFAGIIREARAICGDVVYVTIMNEVNSYDIAKALKPQKSMELYNSLYRDLHAALTEIPDPKDSSRRLRAFIRLVGGDLVERGPGKILVNKKPFDYGPSGQNDWLVGSLQDGQERRVRRVGHDRSSTWAVGAVPSMAHMRSHATLQPPHRATVDSGRSWRRGCRSTTREQIQGTARRPVRCRPQQHITASAGTTQRAEEEHAFFRRRMESQRRGGYSQSWRP